MHIGMYPSTDEAEEAGAKLIAEGIPVALSGRIGRTGSVSLVIDDSDFERARQILDLPTEAPPQTPLRFHPCPSCGATDPIWTGRMKLFVFVAALVALYFAVRNDASPYVFVAAALVVVAAVLLIPEFQCRNCGKRWNRERT